MIFKVTCRFLKDDMQFTLRSFFLRETRPDRFHHPLSLFLLKVNAETNKNSFTLSSSTANLDIQLELIFPENGGWFPP